jgi:hypothetical protein
MLIRSANIFLFGAALLLLSEVCSAQALEPRRWSHLPVGANFLGVAYSYTDTEILFDPALQIEDASAEVHTTVLAYAHVLDFFGKTGRIDVTVPYSNGRWQGLLEGEPASTRRSGFNDPRMRFAVNLYGSPAQRGAEFRNYKVNTIVGAAVEVTAPLGEYQSDKLINLGQNRWVVRPQLGVISNWGKWATELTGSIWFYSDNDELDVDKTREQDPLYSLQTHLIYTFSPGLWLSGSLAYGTGAKSRVDGVPADDRTEKALWALSLGLPINSRNGIKLAYVGGSTKVDRGDDYARVLLAYSVMWGGN